MRYHEEATVFRRLFVYSGPKEFAPGLQDCERGRVTQG